MGRGLGGKEGAAPSPSGGVRVSAFTPTSHSRAGGTLQPGSAALFSTFAGERPEYRLFLERPPPPPPSSRGKGLALSPAAWHPAAEPTSAQRCGRAASSGAPGLAGPRLGGLRSGAGPAQAAASHSAPAGLRRGGRGGGVCPPGPHAPAQQAGLSSHFPARCVKQYWCCSTPEKPSPPLLPEGLRDRGGRARGAAGLLASLCSCSGAPPTEPPSACSLGPRCSRPAHPRGLGGSQRGVDADPGVAPLWFWDFRDKLGCMHARNAAGPRVLARGRQRAGPCPRPGLAHPSLLVIVSLWGTSPWGGCHVLHLTAQSSPLHPTAPS